MIINLMEKHKQLIRLQSEIGEREEITLLFFYLNWVVWMDVEGVWN